MLIAQVSESTKTPSSDTRPICLISKKESMKYVARLTDHSISNAAHMNSISLPCRLIFQIVANLVYNLVSAEVVLVSFKITKRTMRPDMSYIRCCGMLFYFYFDVIKSCM